MKKSKLIVFLLFIFQIVFSQGISDKDKFGRSLYNKALKNLNDFNSFCFLTVLCYALEKKILTKQFNDKN